MKKIMGIVLAILLVIVLAFGALASQVGRVLGPVVPIVNAAIQLEQHLFGGRSQDYTQSDPAMQNVVNYWKDACGTNGTICPEATSGNLQCVMFVVGAFAMANNKLPIWGNAQDFWPLYQNRAGWQEIAAGTGLPAPGDIVVWRGGQYGHVAIAVKVTPPLNGQPGSLVVAQANAPGNQRLSLVASGLGSAVAASIGTATVASTSTATTSNTSMAGSSTSAFVNPNASVYSMPILPNSLAIQTWDGYSVVGFIRQSGTNTVNYTLPGGASARLPNSPWVQVAWNDAVKYNIPPQYFVAQINQESGFQTNAVSPAGAVGIAQFLPSTAVGLSIDPLQPDQALDGAARLMKSYFQQYVGQKTSQDAMSIAYAMALAAYKRWSWDCCIRNQPLC